jgi:hypothetical protein
VMDLRASLSPSPISIRVLQECLVFTPWPFQKKKAPRIINIYFFQIFLPHGRTSIQFPLISLA